MINVLSQSMLKNLLSRLVDLPAHTQIHTHGLLDHAPTCLRFHLIYCYPSMFPECLNLLLKSPQNRSEQRTEPSLYQVHWNRLWPDYQVKRPESFLQSRHPLWTHPWGHLWPDRAPFYHFGEILAILWQSVSGIFFNWPLANDMNIFRVCKVSV